MKVRIVALLVLFGNYNLAAQIAVNNTISLDQAIGIMLGPGVQFSNVTLSGESNQIGSFNSANANVGLNSGVILATGDVMNAVGPNDESAASLGGGNFGATDPDLDQLDGFGHNDAVVIEFDFVATGPEMSFEYVFASEEYPEYTGAGSCGDVSDVFGFFLSGPGINGPFLNDAINIALIPGSTDFVSINNLNAGCDGNAQPGDPNCNYCEYYINNGDGFTSPFNEDEIYVQYDGLTIVLIAAYDNLECGETYHIKLALADVSDTAFDSAVFFKENSFTVSGVVDVTIVNPPVIDWPEATLAEGCIYGAFEVFEDDTTTIDTLQIWYSGTAMNGVDYTLLPDTVIIPLGEISVLIDVEAFNDGIGEGAENVLISYEFMNDCGQLDTAFAEITILEQMPLTLASMPDLNWCPGNPVTATATPQGGFEPYIFDWSTGEGTASIVTDELGSYSVTVTDYCGQTIQETFMTIPSPDPVVSVDESEIYVCEGITANNTATGSGGTTPYVFEWTGSPSTGSTATFDFDDLGLQSVTVTDVCGNTGTIQFEVAEITEQPLVDATPEILYVCLNNDASATAVASSGTPPYTYSWSASVSTSATASYTVNELGTQVVTVTDICGFTGQDEVEVVMVEIEPTVSIPEDSIYVCQTSSETVIALAEGGTPPYSFAWTNSGSNNDQSSYDYEDAGMQYVLLTDHCGYTATDSIKVTIPSPLVARDDFYLCPGSASGNLVEGGTYPYQYYFDSTYFSFTPQDLLTGNTYGFYSVEIIDACGETTSLIIEVRACDTWLPNIITPDGNGKNDTFEVVGGADFPGSSMKIYNRWGNLIYEDADYVQQWDGAENAGGTYYYIYERVDGKIYNGYVMLQKPD